ncbi:MAG: HypC/HybG/HupF family hydrogenase formation chaperone, partial [Acidilobaceae archaeon]
MCWGTPAIITRVVDDLVAEVDFGDGVTRRAILGLSSDKVSSGDVVIVHAGVIVSKLTYEEIEDLMRYLLELSSLAGEDPPQDLMKKLEKILEAAKTAKGGSGN